MELINRIDKLVYKDKIGKGISKTISISNTIKIIANKKNRIENGIRALWFGSNPHSNGDDFSRLEIDRIDKIQAMQNTRIGKIMATLDDVININIY